MWILAAVAVASPGKLAATLDLEQPPHTAVYVRPTGAPALEITTHGPREATARAFPAAGEIAASVDATHARLQIAGVGCASVDARALFDAATAAADGHAAPEQATSALEVDVRPDGTVVLSPTFHRTEGAPLLPWHAGLDDAAVTEDPTAWTARAGSATWTVGRSDGRLIRLTSGEHTIELHHIRLGPESAATSGALKAKPTLPRASEVCPSPTAAALQRDLAAQIGLRAIHEPLLAALAVWPRLAPAARERLRAEQIAWWRLLFAAMSPEGLGRGDAPAIAEQLERDVRALPGMPTDAAALRALLTEPLAAAAVEAGVTPRVE